MVALSNMGDVGFPRILCPQSLPSPEGPQDSPDTVPLLSIHAHPETLTGWAAASIGPRLSDSAPTSGATLLIYWSA